MASLEQFEIEVIKLLIDGVLLPSEIEKVVSSGEVVSCENTGVGYFLTLHHAVLPSERIVCSKPMIEGESNGVHTGFVVFLENNNLTLECYSFGSESVPENYRSERVRIRTA